MKLPNPLPYMSRGTRNAVRDFKVIAAFLCWLLFVPDSDFNEESAKLTGVDRNKKDGE
jgi:hypothetical protein